MFVRCNERLERTVGKSGREVRPSHVLVAKVQKQPRAMGRWEGGSPSRESSAESRGWGEGCTGRQETGSEGSPPPWRLSCSMCLVPVWYSCALRRQREEEQGELSVLQACYWWLSQETPRLGSALPEKGLPPLSLDWHLMRQGGWPGRKGTVGREGGSPAVPTQWPPQAPVFASSP